MLEKLIMNMVKKTDVQTQTALEFSKKNDIMSINRKGTAHGKSI